MNIQINNKIIDFFKHIKINFISNEISFLIVLLFIFSITIILDEFGHLIAGLILGYEIKSFNIGIGFSLFEFYINEINFSFKPLLLGGYVELKDYTLLKNNLFVENLFFYSSGIIINYLVFKSIIKHDINYKDVFISFISLKITKSINLLSENQKENCTNFRNYLHIFAYINIIFVFFNILPLYPLDGGKILFDIIDRNIDDKNIIDILKIISLFLFIIFFIFSNLSEKYFIIFKNEIRNRFILEYKEYINNKNILEYIYSYNNYYLNKHWKKTSKELEKVEKMMNNKNININNDEINLLLKKISNEQNKRKEYLLIQDEIYKNIKN